MTNFLGCTVSCSKGLSTYDYDGGAEYYVPEFLSLSSDTLCRLMVLNAFGSLSQIITIDLMSASYHHTFCISSRSTSTLCLVMIFCSWDCLKKSLARLVSSYLTQDRTVCLFLNSSHSKNFCSLLNLLMMLPSLSLAFFIWLKFSSMNWQLSGIFWQISLTGRTLSSSVLQS